MNEHSFFTKHKALIIFVVVILVLLSLSESDSKTSTSSSTNDFVVPTEIELPTLTPTPSVDTQAPIIFANNDLNRYFTEDEANNPYYGSVYVDVGSWQGNGSIISIPIIGEVHGDVVRVKVDDKDIYWNEAGEIYTRLDLKVELGLNRYLVEAYDRAGNRSEKYLDMTSQEVEEELNINLNEN